MGWFSSAISVLAGLVAIVRAVWNRFYSDTAWRKQREIADAQRRGQEGVEKERLESTYGRIDREPDKHGKDLLDDLRRPRT